MGAINIKHTGSGAAIALSSDGTSLLLDGTAVGGGADLYAANESSPTAQPSATGANAIAIGDSAVASGPNALVGPFSKGSGDFSFSAAGGNSQAWGATGYGAVAIGAGTNARASSSVALGQSAYTETGTQSVAIGDSYASGSHSLSAAISTNNSSYGATGANSIAIGYQSRATGSKAFSHNGGLASGTNSAALFDSRAEAVGDYCIALGNADARGSSSVSINSSNSGFASGNSCFSFGSGAQAGSTSYLSYSSCIAMGYEARAISGDHAIALGFRARARRTNAVAIGERALSDQDGKNSYSSGAFGSIYGSAQSAKYVLRSDTGDATAEALTTNNSTAGAYNQIVLPNNSVYGFTGTVIAREDSSSTNDFAVWEVKGGAVRAGSASTTALGSYNINKISESTGAANWSIALSADTTNGAVAITVTGEASHNIRWVATINTTEVIY